VELVIKNACMSFWMEVREIQWLKHWPNKSDSNFLSSKLKASFETVTPLKPTKKFL
jgi:hypothetical protein